MNEIVKTENVRSTGLLATMAGRFHMNPNHFADTIKKTVMPGGKCTNEQLAAVLIVAHEYNLNPLTKEIYAFPSRGGIQPIVSIDGWLKMINAHPQFDGMEFEDHLDGDGNLSSVTCRIYRKDRSRPTDSTEYMVECKRDTEPWKKWPRRMLRHKSAIQCARYAFSFSGVVDPDEAERMVDITPAQPAMAERLERKSPAGSPQEPQEGFDGALVEEAIESAHAAHTTPDDEPANTGTTAPDSVVPDRAGPHPAKGVGDDAVPIQAPPIEEL